MPLLPNNFPDLLDVRFKRIFSEEYSQLPDRIPEFFFMDDSTRESEKYSAVGTYGDIPQFTGSVKYADIFQGFDMTITHVPFAAGLEISRQLLDDDQFNKIEGRPRSMANGLFKTRQKEAARMFNNGFSVDTKYYSHSEGVALFSNSHATTSGASTAMGFDNFITGSFNAVNVATARIQMRGYRDDQAGRISIIPDTIIHPPELYQDVFEVLGSPEKPDTANRAENVHFGQYTAIEWEYLTSTKNWFMAASRTMKSQMGLIWIDRIPAEFAFVEAFDEIVGKWRLYTRWANGHYDWRWGLGAQVA